MNKKGEKARRSFNYACKQASKCRREMCLISCYSCTIKEGCVIQKRIEKHKLNLEYTGAI